MKYLAFALASSAFLTAPAVAQTAQPASSAAPAAAATAAAPSTVNVAVGAAVSDTTGAPVGTIESVSGGSAILSTGTVKAAIPVASFAKGANGLVVGITKADLEAKVAQASTPQEQRVRERSKRAADRYDGRAVGRRGQGSRRPAKGGG
jgi:hypothetical protein